MQSIIKDKLVLFGAGKIGRSFIGQLFSLGGYEVVFVDINKAVIHELNKRGHYKVVIKSDKEKVLNINNVRGVHSDESEKIIYETSTAGIIAVSVGQDGLESVFPLLAEGLKARACIDINYPLDIIIAENMRNADVYFRTRLLSLLPENYPFDKLVGLVETSIGKMVPIMQKKDIHKDILQVFAEPYNTLILNKQGFRNPIPAISGLAPKDNMKAWVDRKLFIHNLGHSSAAYSGYAYNPEFVYLYEALEIPTVFKFVLETMQQAAVMLMAKYPGEFTMKDLEEHIYDLLNRFQNKALGDTIFRVGCDLIRKLGPHDRLTGAINASRELKLPYDKVLFSLVCGCHFRATDEDGNGFHSDRQFVKIYESGISNVLTKICGFDKLKDKQLIIEAEVFDKSFVTKNLFKIT
jgi:mannitol-1-phosphate 5-dehydrogenase